MIQELDQLQSDLEADSQNIQSIAELEQFRVRYLARKGIIAGWFERIPEFEPAERGLVGKRLNAIKQLAQAILEEKKQYLDTGSSEKSILDLSLPPLQPSLGSLHPLTQIQDEMIEIFRFLGFSIATGPELEHDWYNFEALNFEPDHPARDMQDTYFVSDDLVMRTHTSPVQVRVMETQKPPIRVICPGRVYRNEAVSARSYCLFHQLEGLVIDTNVTMVDLKSVLLAFAKNFFGTETKIKLRPSFFPFTEPSAEVDVSCNICKGVGCRVCKYSGWIEILGCGMVDPNVLISSHIDPEVFSGYAFGMGVERIAMNRLGINDIRLFYENDHRFLKQF